MSLSAAILDAMVASGCTAEQIAAVVKAALASDDARLEQKREKDRERKRRQRHAMSRAVTRTDAESTDTPLSRPPNDINSNPPTHTPGEQTPARVRADDFPKPDFCESDQLWRDFKANRKAKRLPCTPSAHAKLIRDIHALADEDWPPGRLFAEIVARGWAAAHDPRENRKPNNDNRRQGNNNQHTADLAAEKLRGLQ